MLLLVNHRTPHRRTDKEKAMKRITTITAVLALSFVGASNANAGMTLAAPAPKPSVAKAYCDSFRTCVDLAVICKKAGGVFYDTSTGTQNLSAECTTT